MLKISEAQMVDLAAVSLRAFETQLFEFARSTLAAIVGSMSDEALRERIQEDIAAAQSFGIRSARATRRFVVMALLRPEPPRLYQLPAIEQLLRAAGAGVEDAVVWLYDDLCAISALEAQRGPEPGARAAGAAEGA